jgi:hypothetical protein
MYRVLLEASSLVGQGTFSSVVCCRPGLSIINIMQLFTRLAETTNQTRVVRKANPTQMIELNLLYVVSMWSCTFCLPLAKVRKWYSRVQYNWMSTVYCSLQTMYCFLHISMVMYIYIYPTLF